MARLEEMIEERSQLIEDHESGRRKLSEEGYEKASRQFRNFQRKLEQMKNRGDEVRTLCLLVLGAPIWQSVFLGSESHLYFFALRFY